MTGIQYPHVLTTCFFVVTVGRGSRPRGSPDEDDNIQEMYCEDVVRQLCRIFVSFPGGVLHFSFLWCGKGRLVSIFTRWCYGNMDYNHVAIATQNIPKHSGAFYVLNPFESLKTAFD